MLQLLFLSKSYTFKAHSTGFKNKYLCLFTVYFFIFIATVFRVERLSHNAFRIMYINTVHKYNVCNELMSNDHFKLYRYLKFTIGEYRVLIAN